MKVVLKYGGTSVENVEKIKKISTYIKNLVDHGDKIVVVVSAMGGTTNKLINFSQQICKTPSPREVDQLISVGENISAALLASALIENGVNARSLTGWQAGIKTTNHNTKAFIKTINTKKLNSLLQKFDVLVITGFQGISSGNITTLGKGGSDTTAVALAGALKTPCYIFTDVDGIKTADPKILPNAKKFNQVGCNEIMELSGGGAKVMETRSLELAKKFGVRLWVGKSLETNFENGTFIVDKNVFIEDMPIKNLTTKDEVFQLKIGIKTQNLSKFFEILSNFNQKIEMASLIDGVYSCCVEAQNLPILSQQLAQNNFEILETKRVCKIMLVGLGFVTHAQTCKQIFSILNQKNIKLFGLAINELSFSFTVNPQDKIQAVKALAEGFGLVENEKN